MSRNGVGVYSLVSGNPVVTGMIISSTWANNTLSDIATALTNSLASNGETTVIGNIPMASYKLTGLAVATTSGDALSYGQAATVSTLVSTSSYTPTGTVNLTGSTVTVSDPAAALQVVNLQSAQAIFSGGGTPGNIPITSLGVGTATADQYLRVNAGGTAIEGAVALTAFQSFIIADTAYTFRGGL